MSCRADSHNSRRVRHVSSTRWAPWSSWSPPGSTWRARSAASADDRLVGAGRAEMAYYRDHAHTGRDAARSADLRAPLRGDPLRASWGRQVDVETMMARSASAPYPGRRAGARRAARPRAGARLRLELGLLADRRCSSAAASATASTRSSPPPRPAPASPTRRSSPRALELAGCPPGAALHVGDTAGEDVAGAARPGSTRCLLDRDGGGDIASLAEISGRLGSMGG